MLDVGGAPDGLWCQRSRPRHQKALKKGQTEVSHLTSPAENRIVSPRRGRPDRFGPEPWAMRSS